MQFSEHLRKNREFKVVYKRRNARSNHYLVMYIRKNDLSVNRLGISVSKKVGNSVVRHRITRLIRESYRLQEAFFLRGFDIVVVAKPNAKDKSFAEIESALLHLGMLHNMIDGQTRIRK